MRRIITFMSRPGSKENICWLSILLLCYLTLVAVGFYKINSFGSLFIKIHRTSGVENDVILQHATRRTVVEHFVNDSVKNQVKNSESLINIGTNKSFIKSQIDDNRNNDNNSIDVELQYIKVIDEITVEEPFEEIFANNNSNRIQEKKSLVQYYDLMYDATNEIPEDRNVTIARFAQYLHDVSSAHFFNLAALSLPPQTKGVVILTNYRSGSTFLGELFNQHSDAFYTFEPLLPFARDCSKNKRKKIEHLQSYLRCDFQPTPEAYANINSQHAFEEIDRQCMYNNFCFRIKTKELCQRNMCFHPTNMCRKCGPISLPRAMNLCRSKMMSVVKVIRFCDILDLKEIALDPSLDVKIIHLIRDPRGIESSRMKLHETWSLALSAEGLCNRLLNNAMKSRDISNENSWLKNRYLRIRYEDLSMEPLSVAKSIYDFVGLEMNSNIEKWIEENTKSSVSDNTLVNPYATKRNSSLTMQAWRRHLTFEQVNIIQNICSQAMAFYGYKPLSNHNELLNFEIDIL